MFSPLLSFFLFEFSNFRISNSRIFNFRIFNFRILEFSNFNIFVFIFCLHDLQVLMSPVNEWYSPDRDDVKGTKQGRAGRQEEGEEEGEREGGDSRGEEQIDKK